MRHTRKYLRIFAGQFVGVQPDMHIWWTPKLPIVHVANSKAGCSTINQSLKSAQASAYEQAGLAYRRDPSAHVADDCLHDRGLSPVSCRERYLISSVRNPFARLLSAYLDKVLRDDRRLYNEVRHLQNVSFIDFLRALKAFKPNRMDRHFRPQHLNLNYPKIAYDAIFYLENPAALSDFVARIDPHFKLERFAPHASNAAEKLAKHYDATAVQLVCEIFARDFELFGYSRHIDDALAAPAAMIAGGRLIPHGAPLPRPSPQPRLGHTSRTWHTTLRFRRLMERRLI
jgi:hypothetical protein